jgi:vancomycin resistance protein YoaR
MPGDVFSFNGVVGERTQAMGYKPAPTYEGGKTVYTYGGGICQPSSTIYYCALLADLEIVERDCHSYPSVYVPWGMDATVYWGALDFKFRNNTDYPIRIDASADNRGNVSITLMGTDTRDTYVKMENEVIEYYPHKVVEVPFSSTNNPKGYTDGQVITSPVDGYKVRTYRCRYDKLTNELVEKIHEADSVYSTKDKEVAVQTDKPTEPPETEPPVTEPPVTTEPTVPTDPPAATEPPAPVDPPVQDPSTDA